MIYFIQSGNDGPIKIGYSKSDKTLMRRIYAMQTFNSKTLNLLKTIEGGFKEERKIHRLFEYLKLMGEWFKPDMELIEFIDKDKHRHHEYLVLKIIGRIEPQLRERLEDIHRKIKACHDSNDMHQIPELIRAYRVMVEKEKITCPKL